MELNIFNLDVLTTLTMNNYLLNSLNSYFDEILQIERKLLISNSFLHNHKDHLKQQNPTNRELISIITSYRDLSALTADENLFLPAFSYSLDVLGLDEDIDDVASHHSCLAVAQAYEVFESYLVSTLTEYLFHNQESLVRLKWQKEKTTLIRSQIKKIVKDSQGTNNKDLVSAIRKLSGHFREFETNNIHSVNISNWFDLVSMVRHTLVHNRQIMSERLLEYLEKNKADEMFNRHFRKKMIDANVHIYLTQNLATDIINWLNTFAYFIFSGLSREKNLNFDVTQYHPQFL